MEKRNVGASENLLGPEHPDTLTSVNDLAVLFARQEHYDAAEPLFRRVLEGGPRRSCPKKLNKYPMNRERLHGAPETRLSRFMGYFFDFLAIESAVACQVVGLSPRDPLGTRCRYTGGFSESHGQNARRQWIATARPSPHGRTGGELARVAPHPAPYRATYVTLCLDLEDAQHGGVDPNDILREAGTRTTEIHLRNKRGETPTEAFEGGDIDYRKIAATVKQLKLTPLVVIELAYHADTPITRSLRDDLRVSRLYAEGVFSL